MVRARGDAPRGKNPGQFPRVCPPRRANGAAAIMVATVESLEVKLVARLGHGIMAVMSRLAQATCMRRRRSHRQTQRCEVPRKGKQQ